VDISVDYEVSVSPDMDVLIEVAKKVQTDKRYLRLLTYLTNIRPDDIDKVTDMIDVLLKHSN
jgi:predicted nucleotidyltransferase